MTINERVSKILDLHSFAKADLEDLLQALDEVIEARGPSDDATEKRIAAKARFDETWLNLFRNLRAIELEAYDVKDWHGERVDTGVAGSTDELAVFAPTGTQ